MIRNSFIFLLLALSTINCIASTDTNFLEKCIQSKSCLIRSQGEMTETPSMALVLYKKTWDSWSQDEKAEAKLKLKGEALKARTQPEKYTTIPKTAPIYPRIISAIQHIQHYAIVVSSTDGRTKPLQIDNEVETGKLEIPQIVTPNERVVIFNVRPLIRQSLNNPDSLKDFSVLSVSPQRKHPEISDVVVGYRATNKFGALVYQESKFLMSYSEAAKSWSVIPSN